MAKQEPNIAVETFLSLCKWFLIILIINNLIWAGIHFGYYFNSFSGTSVEMQQDGEHNNQSMTNG
jgi:hypothetical protein